MIQVRGATAQKLHGPSCAVQVRGTIMSLWSAVQRRDQKLIEVTGIQTSWKYAGGRPQIESCVIRYCTETMECIPQRWGDAGRSTRSQWL